MGCTCGQTMFHFEEYRETVGCVTSIYYACGNCDEKWIVTNSSHNWIVIPYSDPDAQPTCEQNGYGYRYCSNCTIEEHNIEIPALGHNYSNPQYSWDSYEECNAIAYCANNCGNYIHESGMVSFGGQRDATCTTPAQQEKVATFSNDCFTKQSIWQSVGDALGHNWSDWSIKSATCTESGYEQRHCQREECDATESYSISALGHDPGDEIIEEIVATNCLVTGSRKYACTRCGADVFEETKSGPHSFLDYIYANPTYHSQTCELCKQQQEEEHYGGIEPTCISGTYCAGCGALYRNPNPDNHNIKYKTDPNDKDRCYQYCEDCGSILSESKEHSFINGFCEYCNKQEIYTTTVLLVDADGNKLCEARSNSKEPILTIVKGLWCALDKKVIYVNELIETPGEERKLEVGKDNTITLTLGEKGEDMDTSKEWTGAYLPVINDVQPGFIIDFNKENDETDEFGTTLTINICYPDSEQEISGAIVKIINPATGAYLLKDNLQYKEISQESAKNGTQIMSYNYTTHKHFSISLSSKKDFILPLTAGQSYQCQVRLLEAEEEFKVKDLESWISKEPKKSSQWSSAVLLNAIDNPEINITAIVPSGQSKALISGTFSAQYDSLKWYQIQYKDYTTERIYPRQSDVIEYTLDNLIEESSVYSLRSNTTSFGSYTLIYMTKKGYLGTLNEAQSIVSETQTGIINDELVAFTNIKTQSNEELGSIDLSFTLKNSGLSRVACINIERASLQSDFTKWEKLKALWIKLKTDETDDELIIQDLFAEPGVLYQYRIWVTWEEEIEGEKVSYRTSIQYTEATNILIPEDMFLTTHDLQLRIRYNPEISNWKYNTSDSITPTLGSKYPTVRRNGSQNYATFTIGGLISYNAEIYDDLYYKNRMRENDSIYDDPKQYHFEHYDDMFANSLFFNLDAFKDYNPVYYESLNTVDRTLVLEKLFRDKVIEFLYADDVKLFKSLPEGVKLVRLSNISLTPNKQLGRNIYSFTAQATEVAECTMENFHKYIIDDTDEDYYIYDYVVYIEGVDETTRTGVYVAANELFWHDEQTGEAALLIHRENIEHTEQLESEV